MTSRAARVVDGQAGQQVPPHCVLALRRSVSMICTAESRTGSRVLTVAESKGLR